MNIALLQEYLLYLVGDMQKYELHSYGPGFSWLVVKYRAIYRFVYCT